MDLNQLLNNKISTLMNHRLELSNILRDKTFLLKNINGEVVFKRFLFSLQFEHDLYRGAEYNVSEMSYSPFTSYPDQTNFKVLELNTHGELIEIQIDKLRHDTNRYLNKNLFLKVSQQDPSLFDEIYNQESIYVDTVNSEIGALFMKLDSQKNSKGKGDLSLFFNNLRELNKLIGRDLNEMGMEFLPNELVFNKYNQDLTFLSYCLDFFNKTNKLEMDTIINGFDKFSSHLKDVETKLKKDYIDVNDFFNSFIHKGKHG